MILDFGFWILDCIRAGASRCGAPKQLLAPGVSPVYSDHMHAVARSADTIDARFVPPLRGSGRRVVTYPQLTLGANIVGPLRRRLVIPMLALFALLLAACANGHAHDENGEHPDEVKEHRDQWRPREAQSDFLDIGEQAGIKWLSFVPQDQLDYPEYFESLDRDQKDRLRLAPKGSENQVLLQFDLPEGSKLWPVDWYGTELMAINLPELPGVSVALATADSLDETSRWPAQDLVSRIHQARTNAEASKRIGESNGNSTDGRGIAGKAFRSDDEGGQGPDKLAVLIPARNRGAEPNYGVRRVRGKTTDLVLVAEAAPIDDDGNWQAQSEKQSELLLNLLNSISIKRELALEGSPKHKCSSTLEEQLAGTLRFPDGTLKLSISEGQLVRKIGGDSTIQIDGEGAEPWILIRRLDESEAEGDMRAKLRRDSVFNRRLKVPSAKFSAGFVPEDAAVPIVCFEYSDSSSENNVLGILKAGNELLTFEVVTNGVRDGDKRRDARAAALKLLAGATAVPAVEAPEFEPLIGWNMGSMGRED